jgi:hypothetical protein
MSYTISYANLRYRIRYIATYDIVGHIVGQDTVLANRTYDIVGHIVYDIVCQTYDIVYDFVFSYDIVGGRTVLAYRKLRCRIRYRRFSYDVVYDVVAPHRVNTTSYSTSYSLLTQCRVNTISSVTNDMTLRHCYNIRYGLPGAVGAAGAAAGRTGHVPAPPTAPAS